MSQVIYQEVEKKGTFQIIGNLDALETSKLGMFDEYAEMKDLPEDAKPSPEEQQDLDKFKLIFEEGYDWKPLFDQIPRKKNGTFTKNRQVIIAQAHALSWEDEESYGTRGPQLRLKTVSDTEAVVEYDYGAVIDKW